MPVSDHENACVGVLVHMPKYNACYLDNLTMCQLQFLRVIYMHE